MTTKILRLTAVGVLLGTATLLRAAIGPAESLLPSDTLAFFTVPDCAALRATSKTSPPMMFWNDAAMKPFRDKFMAKLSDKFLAPLEKDLGIKVDDFLTPLQGQFTVAVTVNNSNGHDDVPPGVILLLDAKGQSDLLKTNLATLTKKWTEGGRTLRTEKIRGLAFTVITLSSNELPGLFKKRQSTSETDKDTQPAPSPEIFFTQSQSLLVAGNSAKALDAVAAHLTGGTVPSISDDSVFAADKLSQFRDSPTYYGWANTGKLFGLLTSDKGAGGDEESPFSMFTPAKILNATGLAGLKSICFVSREQAEGSFAGFHLTAPESSRTGLLKILSLPAKDASIPSFVPADAIKFTRVRLDGKQTWDELQRMISSIVPNGLGSINGFIDTANAMAQQKNPAFDLRTYFLGNLRDDIISYEKPPTGDSLEDFSDPPKIYLVAMANTDQAIDAIKTIAGFAGPQDSANGTREFLGHKIYTLSLGGGRARGTADAKPNSLFVSSSGGYVAISKTAGILEEYLRSADGKLRPLREQPGILEAASRVGGMNGGLFSYENQRESMRAAFKLVKGLGSSGSPLMLPAEFREWCDFSLLPDYEPLAKYFYITVCGSNVGSDGMTVKVFAPRPPQLKN